VRSIENLIPGVRFGRRLALVPIPNETARLGVEFDSLSAGIKHATSFSFREANDAFAGGCVNHIVPFAASASFGTFWRPKQEKPQQYQVLALLFRKTETRSACVARVSEILTPNDPVEKPPRRAASGALNESLKRV
jgi:hypothetical protein